MRHVSIRTPMPFALPPPDAALVPLLALAAALGFACGFRPFATVWWLALAGYLQWIVLPAGLDGLLEFPVLLTCAGLALAERVADARAWRGQDEDLLLLSLRVPAGAVLTAAVLLDAMGPWGWLGLPMGAALAASCQALKAALRAVARLACPPLLLSLLLLVFDAFLPVSLALAWQSPLSYFALLLVTLLVALPAAAWWARELRSRWRRWATLGADGPGR